MSSHATGGMRAHAAFESGFSHPLTGSIIGIVGLLVGYILYRASRIGPRPVYQSRALRLIGKEERALPEDVEILFRGRSEDPNP